MWPPKQGAGPWHSTSYSDSFAGSIQLIVTMGSLHKKTTEIVWALFGVFFFIIKVSMYSKMNSV